MCILNVQVLSFLDLTQNAYLVNVYTKIKNVPVPEGAKKGIFF